MAGPLDSAFGNGPADLTPPTTDSASQQLASANRVPAAAPQIQTIPGMTINPSPDGGAEASQDMMGPKGASLDDAEAAQLKAFQSGLSGAQGSAAPASIGASQFGGFNGGASPVDQVTMSKMATPDEQAVFYNKQHGPGSATVRDGTLYVKRIGSTGYHPASAAFSDILGKAAQGDIPGAYDAAKSFEDGHDQDIKAFLTNTAAQLVGGAMGGLAAGPPGAALMATQASMMETYSREKSRLDAVANALGTKNENVEDEAQHAGMVDAVASGALHTIPIALGGLKSTAETFAREAPMNRAKAAVLLENDLRTQAEVWGSKSIADTGEQMIDRLGDMKRTMGERYIGKYVTAVTDAAQAKGAKFDATPLLQEWSQMLQDQGVRFNGLDMTYTPEGSKLPSSLIDDQTAKALGMPPLPKSTASSLGGGGTIVEDLFGPILGHPKGAQTLQMQINDYQKILDAQRLSGGLTPGALTRYDRYWGNVAAPPKMGLPEVDTAMAGKVDDMFGRHRDNFYDQMLAGTDEQQNWARDKDRFGSIKDSVRRINTYFLDNPMTPETVMERALRSKNPEILRNMKNIFGDDNPKLIQSLRGAFIQDALNRTSDVNGMIPMDQLSKTILGCDARVRAEIFNDTDWRKMQAFIKQSAATVTSDLNPSSYPKLKSLADVVLGAGTGNVAKMSRGLYGVFAKNADAYTYLTETYLPERLSMAQASRDKVALHNISDVMGTLEDYKMLSRNVQVGSRTAYIPSPELGRGLKALADMPLQAKQAAVAAGIGVNAAKVDLEKKGSSINRAPQSVKEDQPGGGASFPRRGL